jgi:polyphosphate glucokinase
MQAVGSYEGGRMLFLGLGTGLGSAMIVENVAQPMELAHLPYKDGRTFEECVSEAALDQMGKEAWQGEVAAVVARLQAALEPDYVVLGGGNVRLLKKLPPGCRRGDNKNAFAGGFRLWGDDAVKV